MILGKLILIYKKCTYKIFEKEKKYFNSGIGN